MKKNYYQLLNLSTKATTSEIKKAFRKLALEYHPDTTVNAGNDALFIEIKKAYDTLIDDHKRAIYNQNIFGNYKQQQVAKKPLEYWVAEVDTLSDFVQNNEFKLDYDALLHHLVTLLFETKQYFMYNEFYQQKVTYFFEKYFFCVSFLPASHLKILNDIATKNKLLTALQNEDLQQIITSKKGNIKSGILISLAVLVMVGVLCYFIYYFSN